MIYHFLDIFFVFFHTLLILFNLTGWVWKKTRRLNLIVLVLTGASWLILGLIVGTIGYCPLTDWHFKVLRKLGETNLPTSYLKYLIDRITGMDFNSELVDNVTLYTFLSLLIISILLNIRSLSRRKP